MKSLNFLSVTFGELGTETPAQEIRALATQMRYPGPREQMLRLAAECDLLSEKQNNHFSGR